MALQIEQAPFALQIAFGVCGGLFALCVLTAMFSMFTIFERTKSLVPDEVERDLRWGERKARESNRIWQGLMAPKVRRLRHLMFGAYLLAFASAGVMLLLTAIFGTPIPT